MKGIKSLAVAFATAFLLTFALSPMLAEKTKVMAASKNVMTISTYSELVYCLGPNNYKNIDDEIYLVLADDIKSSDAIVGNYCRLYDTKPHTVHLDLAGHSLIRNCGTIYDTQMFDISLNSTLYIEDSVGGGSISGSCLDAGNTCIFRVTENGHLIVNGGRIASDNYVDNEAVIRCEGGKTTLNIADLFGYKDLIVHNAGILNIYNATLTNYTMKTDTGTYGLSFNSSAGDFTVGNCTMISETNTSNPNKQFYIKVFGNGSASSKSLYNHLISNTKAKVDGEKREISSLGSYIYGSTIELSGNAGLNNVSVGLSEPHHGNLPAKPSAWSSNTVITPYQWTHRDYPIREDERFEAGEEYKLLFTVKSTDKDLYFDKPRVSVNGSTEGVEVKGWSGDEIVCSYTVVPNEAVTNVDMTITKPRLGYAPDFSAGITTNGVYAYGKTPKDNRVIWKDDQGNVLDENSVFEKCTAYTATVRLAYDNPAFSETSKYVTSQTQVRINGTYGKFEGYEGANAIFSITFEAIHNMEHLLPTDPTCDSVGYKKECLHCTDCDRYFLQGGLTEVSASSIVIPKISHNWDTAEYVWAKDGSSCVASRKCTRDSSHIESENAIISSEVKTPATLTSMGTTLYTAKFKNPGFETQTFEVQDIPKLTPTPKPTATPTATPTPKATATPKVTATPVPTVAKPTATSAVTATPTATPVVTSKPTDVATPTDVPTVTPEVTPTTTPSEDPKVQILAFVERIYIYVLDREPETEGAAYWSDELYAFRRTGAEVAQGFIFSQEFIDRNTTDEQFVTILYKTFFGRDADEAGMNYWLGQLSSGTMDRTTVANGFIYSQEWADTCASYGIRSGGELKPTGKIKPTELTYAFVERMYTTAMGRGYDEEGRQYWASELANFNITGEQVGASFFLSAEMEGYKLSDQEFLNRLYATFMNREADADGSAYWLGVMASGTPRADIVYGFTRSPEFTEKCVEARILPF